MLLAELKTYAILETVLTSHRLLKTRLENTISLAENKIHA